MAIKEGDFKFEFHVFDKFMAITEIADCRGDGNLSEIFITKM